MTFLQNPSIAGVSLSLLFGAVWLAFLRPVGWRRPPVWIMLVTGAALFTPVILWVQVPVQNWLSSVLMSLFGPVAMQTQTQLMAIPLILVTGLFQEGAKLLPVVAYWWSRSRFLEPRTGLSLGVMSGIGFGIFEAQWALNSIMAAGLTLDLVGTHGLLALAGFWERVFVVGFHASAGGLAGYGLAKGWGWQFYLLAALAHFALNYLIVWGLTVFQIEALIAVFSLILFAVVLWLRWRHELVLGD